MPGQKKQTNTYITQRQDQDGLGQKQNFPNVQFRHHPFLGHDLAEVIVTPVEELEIIGP